MTVIQHGTPIGPTEDKRSKWLSVKRGFAGRCPQCGVGRLFKGYLKVNDECPHCGEELHHHRADDAPPYFTITIVGHIVVPGLLVVEQVWLPPMWVQFAIWIPITLLLTLVLLPRVKGALIGLQWALRMHGFSDPDDADQPISP